MQRGGWKIPERYNLRGFGNACTYHPLEPKNTFIGIGETSTNHQLGGAFKYVLFSPRTLGN